MNAIRTATARVAAVRSARPGRPSRPVRTGRLVRLGRVAAAATIAVCGFVAVEGATAPPAPSDASTTTATLFWPTGATHAADITLDLPLDDARVAVKGDGRLASGTVT